MKMWYSIILYIYNIYRIILFPAFFLKKNCQTVNCHHTKHPVTKHTDFHLVTYRLTPRYIPTFDPLHGTFRPFTRHVSPRSHDGNGRTKVIPLLSCDNCDNGQCIFCMVKTNAPQKLPFFFVVSKIMLIFAENVKDTAYVVQSISTTGTHECYQ